MSSPVLRVATYNIRHVRALDPPSCWLRRRRRLAAVIRAIAADVWGMQEAYRAQIAWLRRSALGDDWDRAGRGRNPRGGGEACPLWVRRGELEIVRAETRWYGATPHTPGSRLAGARLPRIATLVEVNRRAAGDTFVVANTHLDERSNALRRVSLTQLADWLREGYADRPTIVIGDLNCTLDEEPIVPLLELGLRPLLAPGDGPTANSFGRRAGNRQIDHVLVSAEWAHATATIWRGAGFASDHWPVVAELALPTAGPVVALGG